MDSSKLPKTAVRIQRALILVAVAGCTTLPAPRFTKHEFPKEAYVGDVARPYEVVGTVRSKVNFPSLDPLHEEAELCRNYYNQAVRDLVKFAKQKDADAVIQVKSVVFYEDGKSQTFATPECSDDGEEGQVLTQGTAVKWKKERE